ncbi:MAG: hypothetical protein F6K48_23995 [Okeania sp. SIO3H1]|nr:hypothetical protein [Okeania sp. SIO3H1]
MGRWGDGEMGRWGRWEPTPDPSGGGEFGGMGRWGDEEIETPRNKNLLHSFGCDTPLQILH